MTPVFIIQNHDQTYLSKHGDWVDGSDANQLFRSAYKDEATNVKVELSVRNPHLRLTVLPCQVDAKSQLRLTQPSRCLSIDSTEELMFNDAQESPELHEYSLTDSDRFKTDP